MNPEQRVQPATVSAHVLASSSHGPGQMPTAQLAIIAAGTWQTAVSREPGVIRRRLAADAVVSAVYPRGLTAGRAAGADAVAKHIIDAVEHASRGLGNDRDPGGVVRGLLGRLVTAAQDEARRSRPGDSSDAELRPTTRTGLAAYGDYRDATDAQRAVTAARVAWTHGFQDGWAEAHWSANRIVNVVRHDELVGTTSVDATPTLIWLEDVADAALEIANDGPPLQPAHLARGAGSSVPPVANLAGGHEASSDPPTPAPPTSTRDKDSHRRRGM